MSESGERGRASEGEGRRWRGEETERRREITPGGFETGGQIRCTQGNVAIANLPLRWVLPPILPVGDGLLSSEVAAGRKVQARNRRSLFCCAVGLGRPESLLGELVQSCMIFLRGGGVLEI